jgi:hypothetical protein
LIILNAVKVKNAFLSRDNQGNYELQHYNTIILKITNDGEITLIKPCSVTSTRAINQTLQYLDIRRTCKQICDAKIKQGETIDRSY